MKQSTAIVLALSLFFISLSSLNQVQAAVSAPRDSSKLAKKPRPVDKRALQNIDIDGFSPDILEAAILRRVNDFRESAGVDSLMKHDTLQNASKDQSSYMAKIGEATTAGSGKKKTTGLRVERQGGSRRAEELVLASPAAKGKDVFTYDSVAGAVVAKWKSSKKTLPTLQNPHHVFTGVSASIDRSSRKVYVSMVFGSYNSFNAGSGKKKEMEVPFSSKRYGLAFPLEDKDCKNCEKFKKMEKLSEGITVEDGKVIFRYGDLRGLLKLIKGSKDGFAVDLVQRNQYPCQPYNIMDNNLISKGIMIGRKYKSSLLKGNKIKEKKPKTIEVVLAEIPKKITGEYEVNLLLIQNKKVCRVLTRRYYNDGGVIATAPLDIIPDTNVGPANRFLPSAETVLLNPFRIPFEKNKAEYRQEDIIPFIKALNEPDFIINQIFISAYSSIEGDSVQNSKLQLKRAESMIKAIETWQRSETTKQVKTDDSWPQFQSDVKGTEFEYLASLSKAEANKTIFNKGLVKKLEPVLAKGRYAEVLMEVTYDIKGPKEIPYVVKTMQKAINKQEVARAQAMQTFAMQKVMARQYPVACMDTLKIPREAAYASLLMNRLWFEKWKKKETLDEDHWMEIKELQKMAPSNEVITYNALFCFIKLGWIGNKFRADSLQRKIDALQNSKTIPPVAVDGLNLELQFKILDEMDTTDIPNDTLINETVERIKKIFKIEEATPENAHKLASIFMRHGDFSFALRVIEPFALEKKVSEKLLFTYLSICSYVPGKIYTSKFASAMSKARELNRAKYCELFGAPQLSFQVLDNTVVKEEYCKVCK